MTMMMASSTEPEIHTSPEIGPTKTKAGSIRKLRIPKACYPCYKRKVKCDKNSPCSLCVKRGYAHLCTFTHPPTTSSKARISSQSAAAVARHADNWHADRDGGIIIKNNSNKSHCCSDRPLNTATTTPTPTNTKPKSSTIVTESGNVLIDTQEWRHIQDKLAVLSQSIHSLRSQLETSVSSSSASTPPASSPSASVEPSPISTPPLDHSNTTTLSPIPLQNIEEKTGLGGGGGGGGGGGVRTLNALGGSPVHCGSDSVMGFLLEKKSDHQLQKSVFREESVLSQLALDNQSATYPFLDLWSSNITSYSNESVCAALPDDSVCRRLLRSYHDIRLTLYPVLPDFDQFQKDVHTLLTNRTLQVMCANNVMALTAPYGFSISFVGVLFAVLASGCQVSDFAKNERKAMCQLYISCAYQCLRNANFLSRPNMEAVQTLLIIGDVLSYNMNPGIAYVTFGVAQRMALTLGLHAESFIFKDPSANRRQELWWSMAWQDSHFGLSYDRPIETLSSSPPIPRAPGSRPGIRGYFETMCSVISLILQLLREETLMGSKVNNHTIPAYKIELDKVLADAAPHLRSEDYCFTLKNHVERLSLKLRSSYLVSEICRRSLKQTPCDGGAGSTKQASSAAAMAPHLCQECIDSLISTIEAYIEMHEIIPHGSRSWIHLHSAISAAFLLSVDEGAQSEPNVWTMLEKLEKVFCDLTSAADNSPDQLSRSPDSRREWSPFSPTNTATATATATATPFNNNNPNSDPTTKRPPVVGDHHFADGSNMHSSFGHTFMLSDFPLGVDSLMIFGGGLNSRAMMMPASDGGVEFLTGTLNSLRKINAGFKEQRARVGTSKPAEKKAGACCLSRSTRDVNPGGCHSRQRNYV